MKLPEIFDALTAAQLTLFNALKPSHQQFIIEYLVDHNETQAAKRAGFSGKSAHVTGCRMLKKVKPLVMALVQAQTIHLANVTGMDKEKLVKLIEGMVLFDPAKFFDEHGNVKDIPSIDSFTRMALSGFEVTEEFSGKGDSRESIGFTKKIKLADRFQYVQLLAKIYGVVSEDGPQRPQTPLEKATVATLLKMQEMAEAQLAKMHPPKLIGNGTNGGANGSGRR